MSERDGGAEAARADDQRRDVVRMHLQPRRCRTFRPDVESARLRLRCRPAFGHRRRRSGSLPALRMRLGRPGFFEGFVWDALGLFEMFRTLLGLF